MAFPLHNNVLLGFINCLVIASAKLKKHIEAIVSDILVYILNILGYSLPRLSLANSTDSLDDNFNYFWGDNNPENNGSSSNSNSNNNNNNNPDNNEDANSNDVDMSDNHNGPESIMDDLDKLDKARKNNDQEALNELKQDYPAFFEDNTDKEALNEIEKYLEEEFPAEIKRSELEADAMDARQNAEEREKVAERLESLAEETTDPVRSAYIRGKAQAQREEADAERKKADELDAKAKGVSIDSNNYDAGNDCSGGSGHFGPCPSGSGSGPSNSSGDGGNLSKILIIFGPILETVSKVLEDIGNYM